MQVGVTLDEWRERVGGVTEGKCAKVCVELKSILEKLCEGDNLCKI